MSSGVPMDSIQVFQKSEINEDNLCSERRNISLPKEEPAVERHQPPNVSMNQYTVRITVINPETCELSERLVFAALLADSAG